jgi:uncharacterized protein (DUF169 family)
MSNSDIARELTRSLELDTPPVAIAFVDAPPAGVTTTSAAVPSTCAFWRTAETQVFYAPADAHFNCPVGAFVMGFDLPKTVSDELMELVGTMTKCGYISAEEPAKIPGNPKKAANGVVYGPLAQFPMAPDAVLAWVTPAQAMVWNEAVGGAEWGGAQPSTVFGRPACAAVPSALVNGKASLSLGCMGMRTFTGIAGDKMLAVIAGSNAQNAAERASAMRRVNDQMEVFYKGRAARLGEAL